MSKLFLLSVEESKKIPQIILACGSWCWLRSPGYYPGYAATASPFGSMNVLGSDVDNDFYSVRPALHLTSDVSNFEFECTKKGYLKFGHKPNSKSIKWIDISEYVGFPCMLMKKAYGYYRFGKESNVYETSEIYKRLQELDNKFFTDEEKTIIKDFELKESEDENK